MKLCFPKYMFMYNCFSLDTLIFSLLFIPPLQGEVGPPGEAGGPGPKGDKVSCFYSSLLKC